MTEHCTCVVVEEVYSRGGDIIAFQCVACNRSQRVSVCCACNAILNGDSAHREGCEPSNYDPVIRTYNASETSEEKSMQPVHRTKDSVSSTLPQLQRIGNGAAAGTC